MRRLIVFLMILLAVRTVARAEGIGQDLAGTWRFCGGGEVMGYGFRLEADGKGEWMDTNDTEHFPVKHLFPTGAAFTWRLDGNVLTVRSPKGEAQSYPLMWYSGRLHFASGDGGGFYQRFDEERLRLRLEARARFGEASAYDRLVLDYLDDEFEENLADRLGLLSVNADTDPEAQEPAVTAEGWHQGLDMTVWFRFTASCTEVWAGGSSAADSLAYASVPCSGSEPGSDAGLYYDAAEDALQKAAPDEKKARFVISGNVLVQTPVPDWKQHVYSQLHTYGLPEDFAELVREFISGDLTKKLRGWGLEQTETALQWTEGTRAVWIRGVRASDGLSVVCRCAPDGVYAWAGDAAAYDGALNRFPAELLKAADAPAGGSVENVLYNCVIGE